MSTKELVERLERERATCFEHEREAIRVIEKLKADLSYRTERLVDATERAIAAKAEAAALRARVAKMEDALKQCKEYLTYSLGSTSEINPYPALEAALTEEQP